MTDTGMRAYGGAGLGLTTAARLAETGEITARAEPGQGSEFVLTLPATVVQKA
ncbi:MAG: ATP-binding protein [Myxococcota bacterium]